MILSQKAARIQAGVSLGAWLFKTAGFVVKNIVRRESTRRRHEAAAPIEAFAEYPAAADPVDSLQVWEIAGPALNTAICRLRPKQRDAVVLHFLEGKSLGEVAQETGCSADAVRKRVEYALIKLRSQLQSDGMTLSTGALLWGLRGEAARAAPPVLRTIAAHGATGASSTVVALAHQTNRWIAWHLVGKTVAAACAACAVPAAVTGITVAAIKHQRQTAIARTTAPIAFVSASNWSPVGSQAPPSKGLASSKDLGARNGTGPSTPELPSSDSDFGLGTLPARAELHQPVAHRDLEEAVADPQLKPATPPRPTELPHLARDSAGTAVGATDSSAAPLDNQETVKAIPIGLTPLPPAKHDASRPPYFADRPTDLAEADASPSAPSRGYRARWPVLPDPFPADNAPPFRLGLDEGHWHGGSSRPDTSEQKPPPETIRKHSLAEPLKNSAGN